jgi:hypothetical protein
VTEPEMKWVDSTNVESIGYDGETMELHVRFKSGPVMYIYVNVPESTFDDLMAAPSKGSYLNREIKPNYQFRTE